MNNSEKITLKQMIRIAESIGYKELCRIDRDHWFIYKKALIEYKRKHDALFLYQHIYSDKKVVVWCQNNVDSYEIYKVFKDLSNFIKEEEMVI